MDQDKKFLPVAVAKQINSTTEKSDGAQEHQITFVASSTSEDRAHEIVRAFVVGDGRSKPETGADNRMFDGTRGIWSFKADLDRAKGSGKEDIDEYSRAVAAVIKNTEGDNSYDKAVKSLRGLKAGGEKVIFAAPGFLTGIMLAKDDQGRYQFGAGTDAESLLKATVYEEDFMLVKSNGSSFLAYRHMYGEASS